MKLLIVRHAIAMKREEFHQPEPRDDSERPLTTGGIQKMKVNSQGLLQLIPLIGVFFHSPYQRAQQTTEILLDFYRDSSSQPLSTLEPHVHPNELLSYLENYKTQPSQINAIVGHEPHLSSFISYCLAGNENSFIRLKKGGAALIEWPTSKVAPGQARLLWLLTPKQLSGYQPTK